MGSLDIPETGLSLWRGDQPGDVSLDPTAKPTQIMRLNLPQATLDELVKCLRKDQPARLRFGKHQTLYYGSKSRQFHSCSETHQAELYRSSPADKENAYFAGVLCHSLEVQKAKEATAATDEALANLEQRLNAFERGKESRKTPLITNIQDMRALGAGDSRSATGRQAANLARLPTSKIDAEKERFFKNPTNRSIPGSPALGVPRSPASVAALTPTSVPTSQNKQSNRLAALQIPFIHLLAVRAVSVKFLAQQTRSCQEDCLTLARKYGTKNRLNREKFDLRDKAYRELDVWNFPYPSQDDRHEAIENAISAFDRMRVSRSDKLWQMLLPKEERGKGKALSRLNLSTGPMKKDVTPRIQVHASEDTGKDGDATGNETDRTNGRLTPTAAERIPASKPGTSTQKKRVSEKDSTTKRNASAKAKNTTLTGRVTKKTEKKASAKPDSKFKSAEYVHDSDEEDTGMADAPPPPKKPASSASDKNRVPAKTGSKSTSFKTVSDSHSSAVKQQHKPESSSHSVKTTPNSTNATSSKTLPSSSWPSNSNSPQKRSPLASPPTNASDIDHSTRDSSRTSSSSSSPLITQVSRPPRASLNSSKAKNSPKTNGVPKPPPPPANPLKRKEAPERDDPVAISRVAGRPNGHVDVKRRRAVTSPSSSGTSSGSASPPLSQDLLRQQLREKSLRFKQYYAKYRALHDLLAACSDPAPSELEKLKQQHARLQRMKKDIWDEDRRLRNG